MLKKLTKHEFLDLASVGEPLTACHVSGATAQENSLKGLLQKSHLENILFKNCTFQTWNVQDCQFTRCRFLDCDFKETAFSSTVLESCLFDNTRFVDVKFSSCEMDLCQFQACAGKVFSLTRLKAPLSVWSGCKFEDSVIDSALMVFSDMSHCEFLNTYINGSDFSGVIFRGSEFKEVSFKSSNLQIACLDDMKYETLVLDATNCFGLSVLGVDLSNLDTSKAIWEGVITKAQS